MFVVLLLLSLSGRQNRGKGSSESSLYCILHITDSSVTKKYKLTRNFSIHPFLNSTGSKMNRPVNSG